MFLSSIRIIIIVFVLVSILSISEIIFSEKNFDPKDRSQFTIQIPTVGTNKNPLINVLDAGVKGDGVTDDTAAIQRIVSEANQRTVYFPKGTYLLTAPVVIEQPGLALIGEEAKILFKPGIHRPNKLLQVRESKTGMADLPVSFFLIKGNLENLSWELAETALAQAKTVKLTGQVNLIPGDIVILSSKSYGKASECRKKTLLFNRELNFMTMVSGVSGNQITFRDPLPVEMAVENSPRLFKVMPVRDVTVSGFQLEIFGNSQESDISGITLVYAVNVVVEKVTIQNTSLAGIDLSHCYHCKVAGNIIKDSTKFDSANGYGINLNRSHFCLVQNNVLTNHRHGIILNHGNSNCLVENNEVNYCQTTASIDLHGEYNSWNVIRSNYINGGKTGIVIGGGGEMHYNDGPFNCIVGNTISKCKIGIELKNETEAIMVGTNYYQDVQEEIIFTNIPDNNIIKF